MLPLGVRIPLSLLPFLVAGRGARCDELTCVTVRVAGVVLTRKVWACYCWCRQHGAGLSHSRVLVGFSPVV